MMQLLLAYVSTVCYEGPEVDINTIEKDAKDLFKAGEKELGTNENTFIRIFSERSWAHLAATSIAYYRMYGSSLKKVLSSLQFPTYLCFSKCFHCTNDCSFQSLCSFSSLR